MAKGKRVSERLRKAAADRQSAARFGSKKEFLQFERQIGREKIKKTVILL